MLDLDNVLIQIVVYILKQLVAPTKRKAKSMRSAHNSGIVLSPRTAGFYVSIKYNTSHKLGTSHKKNRITISQFVTNQQ